MKKLLEYKTGDGDIFYVEVTDQIPDEPVRGGVPGEATRGVIKNAAESFEQAINPLKGISSSIINSIKEIAHSPDEVEVELGFKFSAKAGIILTSLDSEANLKIALKWKKASG